MRSRNKSLFLVLDGSPFQLSGHDVRLAAGAEYRELDFRFTNAITNAPFAADTLAVSAPTSRNVKSAFAEVFIPLVSNETGIGIARLDLSAAVRHERYSDFGTSTVPRFGFDFEPISGFLIQGAYSRSFRAPDLTTLSGANNSATLLGIADPARPGGGTSQVLLLGGAVNSELRPERGRTFTLGWVITPPVLPRLRIGATFFDIAYVDRLATVLTGVNLSTILRNPIYDEIILYNPTSQQQAEGCAIALSPPVNCSTAPIVAIVDGRTRNVSTTSTTGVDFRIGYSWTLRNGGSIALGLNGTSIFTYRETLSRGSPLVSRLNESGNPIDFRGRASVTYRQGGFTAGVTASYTAPSRRIVRLTNSTNIIPVDSLTTFDFHAGYEVGSEAGLLSNLSIRLNVSNIFDKDPPFADFLYGYDGGNFDPLGRVISLSITKRW